MTDYEALLATVLERPEEDTPRLVLADWLEEHGNGHWAELIRVQIAIANYPKSTAEDYGMVQELQDQADELIGLRPREFVSERGIMVFHSAIWRRGFIEEIEIRWEEWLNAHTNMLSNLPIKIVHLMDAPPVDVPGNGYIGDGHWRTKWPHIQFSTPDPPVEVQRYRGGNTCDVSVRGKIHTVRYRDFGYGPDTNAHEIDWEFEEESPVLSEDEYQEVEEQVYRASYEYSQDDYCED